MKRDIKSLLSEINEDTLDNLSDEELEVIETALDLVNEEDEDEDGEEEDEVKNKSNSDDDEDDDDDDDDEDEEEKDVKESFNEALNIFLDNVSFDEDAEALKAAISEDFSEEDAEKVRTVLETVHKAKLRTFGESLVEFMSEQFWDTLDESVAAVENYLEEKADAYLKEAVSDWIEAHEVELQEARDVEAARGFFDAMQELMESYGMRAVIDPEAKDTIAALEEQVESLMARNDESHEAVIGLNEEVLELQKRMILMEQTEGMTDMQRETIMEYASEIRTDDMQKYASKLGMIIESVGDSLDAIDDDIKSFAEDFGYEEEDIETIVESEDDEDGEMIKEDRKVDDKVARLMQELTPRH